MLGTVQFGLPYGIAGSGEAVPEPEVRAILELAAACGIRCLDTAPAYGEIEARLSALIEDLPLSVVSKVAAVPEECSVRAAERVVAESIERSQARLGARLKALLFHRADDLLGPIGDRVWAAANAVSGTLPLGVSCYDPLTLQRVRDRYPVAIAQLPGSALDQRLAAPGVAAAMDGVEIHIRSVYLQGLLLLSAGDAIRRLPAAATALRHWHEWCRSRGQSPLVAALAIARALPGVSSCVIGVDSVAQLRQLIDAWTQAAPLLAPELACDDTRVIDPRRWHEKED